MTVGGCHECRNMRIELVTSNTNKLTLTLLEEEGAHELRVGALLVLKALILHTQTHAQTQKLK